MRVHGESTVWIRILQVRYGCIGIAAKNEIKVSRESIAMDRDPPKTRRETKKDPKKKKSSVYSAKHIRQVEALKQQSKQ